MAGGRIKGLTVTIDGDTTGLSGLWCQAPRPGGSNIDWGDMSAFPYTCPVCNTVIPTKEALFSHIVGEIAQSIQGLADSSRETEINTVK